MARKIVMTGKNAQYIEHRGVNAVADNDRDIRMEGDEAVYREYAYGQPAQPTQQQKETSAEDEGEEKLLMANGEYFEPIKDVEVAERLKPIFYNKEDEVMTFLSEIKGMPAGDITDLVNRWVRDKRISDYGNSRKGSLWEILHEAGLYTKSRQNWNRRVY